MSTADIVIVIVLAAAVVAAVAVIISRRKKGKRCSCDCGNCAFKCDKRK